MYIFSNGRMISDKSNLPIDELDYIEVQELPPVKPIEGMGGYFYNNNGKLDFMYMPIVEEAPEITPEPDMMVDTLIEITPEPTNSEVMAELQEIKELIKNNSYKLY